MREVVLFCEDPFHEEFVDAVLQRLASDQQVPVKVRTLSGEGGFPRMRNSLKTFLRDLSQSRVPLPDAAVIVLDANCAGYQERLKSVRSLAEKHEALQNLLVYAIPDPHIERWMLLDPAAFAAVFGRGCTLPAAKCDKDEYKRLLRKEIRESGRQTLLGGREYARLVVAKLDFARAAKEPSFGHFVRSLTGRLQQWKSGRS